MQIMVKSHYSKCQYNEKALQNKFFQTLVNLPYLGSQPDNTMFPNVRQYAVPNGTSSVLQLKKFKLNPSNLQI